MMNNTYSRKKRGYTGWIIIILIVAIIALTIFIGRFFKKEEEIKVAFENGDNLAFFIAGYNNEKKITGGSVVFFNTRTNKTMIVSMLPKTYIKFSKKQYSTLEEILQKNVSYENIINGISNVVNHQIDYYILIEKNKFVKLIDLLGGINITTEALKNPELKVFIPGGDINLDGDKSVEYLSYVNLEEKKGEYRQLERIQNYLEGFLKLRNDFLEQFTEEIVRNYIYELIDTNMSLNEFTILYNEIVKNYKNGITDYSRNIRNIILYCDEQKIKDDKVVYFPTDSGIWIKKEVKESLESLSKVDLMTDINKISIEVLNGTESVGLASRTGDYLYSHGFDVINVANADREDYINTVVVSYGNLEKANKLAELIHCKNIITNNEEEVENVDVTLILGFDFDGKYVR